MQSLAKTPLQDAGLAASRVPAPSFTSPSAAPRLRTPSFQRVATTVNFRRAAASSAADRLPVVPASYSDSVRDFGGRYGNGSRKTPSGGRPPGATVMDEASTSAAEHRTASDMEAALMELSDEERSTVALFRYASPSVVNVNTSVRTAVLFPLNIMEIPSGVGSGFVWDKRGHVVTNNHVVANASEVKVTLSDGSVHRAKVIGKDAQRDVAVLELFELSAAQRAALTPLSLGVSSRLMVGQKVYAIGNPFGLDQTLTQGIVSGLGREINAPSGKRGGSRPISNVIQTDAAINPGNSGGPLLDARGRVVGINTAIADPTGVGISSGVGFAIPIDVVKGLVDQLLTYGRVMRPSLGISIFEPSPEAKRQLLRDKGDAAGVIVATVVPNGPAAQAGISGMTPVFGLLAPAVGDVILGLCGRPVRSQKDLFAVLDTLKVGASVEVTLWRNGSMRTVRLTLADQEKLY